MYKTFWTEENLQHVSFCLGICETKDLRWFRRQGNASFILLFGHKNPLFYIPALWDIFSYSAVSVRLVRMVPFARYTVSHWYSWPQNKLRKVYEYYLALSLAAQSTFSPKLFIPALSIPSVVSLSLILALSLGFVWLTSSEWKLLICISHSFFFTLLSIAQLIKTSDMHVRVPGSSLGCVFK